MISFATSTFSAGGQTHMAAGTNRKRTPYQALKQHLRMEVFKWSVEPRDLLKEAFLLVLT